MHGVELLLEQRSICFSSIEFFEWIALLLRNDLMVNPPRAPSLKVRLSLASSGRGGATLSISDLTMLPSFLSSFSACAVVWRMVGSRDISRALSKPGILKGPSSV